ncbi:SusC/RagA family TonB-linked outer membrane protein [Ihuprevotella massiliensis]|jgi:tonB-linked outer membrane protein, susC/ragA family|uniref:SusC/RagA family TonB-linked outer membrane protein n=1 Tax=Ihuprevotella massiliensis TaxID=1852368 RepID=UPI00094E47DC
MRLVLIPLSTLLAGASLTASAAQALPPLPVAQTAQQNDPTGKVIKGRVIDGNGEPLVGATIKLKGGNGVYFTDHNGNFEIITKKNREEITVTYLGHVSQTLFVFPGNETTIPLAADNTSLSEVVITGFVNKSKVSFTGSQTTVQKDQLLSMGTKNVLESLQSFVPGLVISENNLAGSNPNSRPELSIRGRATFDGSANMPLFVVDGTEVSADYVYDMDMNDIESVTVLKDASASALYGSKASAGVIVITTKTMKPGRLRLNYSGTYRLSTPDLTDYHMLNAAQKLEFERLAGLYTSTDLERQYRLDNEYNHLAQIVRSGVNTDWLSKPLRNGFSQNHSLSIDGGDDYARYNLGLRYATDDGVMIGSKRDRLSLFFKFSYNKPGAFSVNNSTTLMTVDSEDSPYGSFSDYTQQNPYESPYNEDGSLRKNLSNFINNPLYEAQAGNFKKSENVNILNTTTLQVWFSDAFRLNGDFSFTKDMTTSNRFTSPLSFSELTKTDMSQRGSLTESHSNLLRYAGKLMLSYNKNLFGKLFTSATAGSTIEANNGDNTSYTSIGYYSANLSHPSFAAAYQQGKPNGSDNIYRTVGFFANLNSIWDNKYFLDLIYRYEGSSKFGKNTRFAPFWSVGAGWNIHNESFLQGKGIELLKLRASIGYLGNISFEPYQAITSYNYASGYNYVKGIGAIPKTIGNPDLRWERTLTSNVGIDLTMFKGRWDLTFDAYVKNTDDLLVNVTKAPSVGVTTARENLGAIENKGVELRTRVMPIKNKNLQWSISATYAYNKSKIKQISNALMSKNEENRNAKGTAPLPIYEEGGSLTALKVVPSAGIDPATGREIYIKRDGTYTFDYDARDKVTFGDEAPWAQGSLSSYLTYKQWSASASFGYSLGGLVYNQTLATRVEGADPKYNADERVFNDRWKQPGNYAKYRNIADYSTPQQTSRFVQVNNYLTLQSLSVAYDFTPWQIRKLGLTRLRLELLTNDLFYLSSIKRERGLDYPYARSVEMSVRFSF